MSCDALFQLGMGSALLKASQEEDSLAARASFARAMSRRTEAMHGTSALSIRSAQLRSGSAVKTAARLMEFGH